MPLAEWLPQLKNSTMMQNLVASSGGGVEVAGVVQVFADLMLQSITPIGVSVGVDVNGGGADAHYLALFPLQFPTDMEFSKLRGKGGFLVSASWDAASKSLAGSAELLSVDGNPCRILLPWMLSQQTIKVAVKSSGVAVHTTAGKVHGSVSFPTTAGVSYIVTVGGDSALIKIPRTRAD